MFPVIDAKRKFAPHGALAHAPGKTNSVATGFATVPVGSPPGIVTVGMLGFSTTGAPPTSPRISWVVLVPLFATQNGLEAVAVMPHGLTSNGSSTGANPGESVIRFVWRYADPGAITGMSVGPVGLCAVSLGAANPSTNMITARNPNTKLPIRFAQFIDLMCRIMFPPML